MMVIQFAGICLLWLNGQITLPIYSLGNLLHSTGYSHVYSTSPANGYPPYGAEFDFDSSFFVSNFNYMGVLYLMCLLILLIAKILSVCAVGNESKIAAQERIETCCEMLMYACMFNFTYLLACAIVFYRQGDFADVPSQAICAASLFITIATFIAFGI